MPTLKKIKLLAVLAWRISPSYIFLLFLRSFASAGQIFSNVIFPKYLIDELIGSQRIGTLIFWASMIILFNALFYFLNQLLERTHKIRRQWVSTKMWQAMSEKIMSVPYAYLEDPYYLDLKERAVFVLTNQDALTALISYASDLLKNAITLLGLIVLMFTLSVPYMLILLAITALSLVVYQRFMKYESLMYQAIIPFNRKLNYYAGLSMQDVLQKDIRLYQMAPMLTGKIMEYNREIVRESVAYNRKFGLRDGIISIFNDLRAAVAYGYTALRVIPGFSPSPLSLGSFTMYISSAIQFTTAMSKMWENGIKSSKMLEYLDPFAQFMELPDEDLSQQGIPFEGEIRSIRFEDVCFSYPKSDKIVLDHISFSVEDGQKISIVGLNGAGKTTLVKLLCRLYSPTAGTIYVNGTDISQYEYKSYLRQIAAVFQDYKIFAFTIEENITGRDLGADTPGAVTVAEEVGLAETIEALPEKMASFYGKAYDEKGVQMSGGQAQKLAIARALYKHASLVILDEPTSALDPLAEAEIYQNFNEMVRGKTALYISHRMSSSVFCDKILVLDHARVAAFAPHQELMKDTDSLYYQLFMAQARNYQLEN